MNRFKIGIDLDSVLNNLEDVWLAHYNRDYNDCMIPEDLVSWHIHELVKPECGEKIYDYIKQKHFFLQMKPKPNAINVTKWLCDLADVYVVTASEPFTVEDKCKWLQRYYPHIPLERVIISHQKSMINVDYLIDDGAHNIISFPRTAIVFDMPHNRHLKHKYVRAFSWLDIQRFFQPILERGDE